MIDGSRTNFVHWPDDVQMEAFLRSIHEAGMKVTLILQVTLALGVPIALGEQKIPEPNPADYGHDPFNRYRVVRVVSEPERLRLLETFRSAINNPEYRGIQKVQGGVPLLQIGSCTLELYVNSYFQDEAASRRYDIRLSYGLDRVPPECLQGSRR